MSSLSRRAFVAAGPAAVLAAPALAPRAAAEEMIRRLDGGLPETFPAQDRDAVRAVVGKSHVDYEAVRDMVAARPELAKASWDWGFGDWESALGAASHMGRPDIAELLVAHGARPNLFTFAMLGQVDVVRAVCEANPGIQRVRGPHGITLLRHARAGGDRAASVVEHLEQLGGADDGEEDLPLDAGTTQRYPGEYVPDGAPGVVLRVAIHERRGGLTLARDEQQFRFLMHRGDDVFSPVGAPSVRIAFDVRDDRAAALTITDGPLRVTARA